MRSSVLKKAWEAGFTDPVWVRRNPDLAVLRGDPEFERLYPAGAVDQALSLLGRLAAAGDDRRRKRF